VHHEHALAQVAHLERARPTAARDQPGHGASAQRQQVVRARAQALGGALGFGHLRQLHLRRHQRFADLGAKAAFAPHHAGGVRGGRDDAGLFDDHGDESIAVVDACIQRDAERQPIGAEHVLDDLICHRGVDAAAVEALDQLVELDAGNVAHGAPPQGERQAVEAGNS
jgi:hypothetical protein